MNINSIIPAQQTEFKGILLTIFAFSSISRKSMGVFSDIVANHCHLGHIAPFLHICLRFCMISFSQNKEAYPPLFEWRTSFFFTRIR
ncbi:hypothetical protein DL346_06895 [Paenibacillus montanisoli]|uniref:Uncharacterized protein n=1 Tax=Paenibacillus montanisoli TaxID=2081970 RepID=A0A328UDL4_9BACL|nr:hypothetical protein DL346_06895 [Paenibacillus montanisoli]